jgi:hypothetical protein
MLDHQRKAQDMAAGFAKRAGEDPTGVIRPDGNVPREGLDCVLCLVRQPQALWLGITELVRALGQVGQAAEGVPGLSLVSDGSCQ